MAEEFTKIYFRKEDLKHSTEVTNHKLKSEKKFSLGNTNWNSHNSMYSQWGAPYPGGKHNDLQVKDSSVFPPVNSFKLVETSGTYQWASAQYLTP